MPVVRSTPEHGDGSIRPVSPNGYRFATGRIVLLVEGVVLIVLGVAQLLTGAAGPAGLPLGAPTWLPQLTATHSIVLLLTGVAALGCAWRRRAALVLSGVQAVAYLLVFAVGVTLAARHVPTSMGFDDADAVLDGAIAVLGLAVFMWIAGEALEGRWWVRR